MTRFLTPLQLRFCDYLLAGDSPTQAARRAGYSPAMIKVRAGKMARSPAIMARLEQLRAERVDRREIIGELTRIAYCDLAAATDGAGTILGGEAIRRRLAGTIATLEVTDFKDKAGHTVKTTTRVTAWDKFKALDRLAQIAEAKDPGDPGPATGRALRPMDEDDFAAGERMAAILAAVEAREKARGA